MSACANSHEPVSGYRTADVPVRGGTLRVGVWVSDDVAAGAVPQRTVLALHGVTASHLSWALVAAELTEASGVRVLAPDLRGRGRSADLPGPWGMPVHADDAAAALDAFDAPTVIVVGHSMGAFAAMVFAHRHRLRTESIVLVDGGIPLPPPDGLTADEALQATLGPAAQRLSMTFPSRADYGEFWRRHPAFAADWSHAVAAYVDYDLVGEPPAMRSSCRYEAVAADSAQLAGDGSLLAAWDELSHDTLFLRAPAGLLAEPPGLYPPAVVARWAERFDRLRWREVPGVNHYTITLAPLGAHAVADAIVHAPDARSVTPP